MYALTLTSDARKGLETATDEECIGIMRDRIWPVFEQVCLVAHGHGVAGSASLAGTGKGRELAFTPRGTVTRQDVSVQSPVQPSAPFTGRAITGEGDSLSEDGGISVPTGSPGAAVQAGDPRTNRPPVPGSGGGQAPSPGSGSPGAGPLSSGLAATADGVRDACTKSSDLLDTLPPPTPARDDDGSPAGTQSEDAWETASALSGLSHRIDDLAGALEEHLHTLRDAYSPERAGQDVPDRYHEEIDEVAEGLAKGQEGCERLQRGGRGAWPPD